MAGEQQRVVGAFDDPDDAEAAKEALARRDHEPEESAEEDADVAFASTEEKGDSAERPPDRTVAVEVDDAESAAAELRRRGAEDVEVREPATPDDPSAYPRPDEP